MKWIALTNKTSAARQFARTPSLIFFLFVLPLPSGCVTVTGLIQPMHFQFTTVVQKTESGPDGWRAACVHAKIKNGTTGDVFFCKFGVEMPIESDAGPISLPLAQRIAADCANQAVYAILEAVSGDRDPPLGMLCENFRADYRVRLSAAIPGSRVTRTCDPHTTPTVFGELTSYPEQ